MIHNKAADDTEPVSVTTCTHPVVQQSRILALRSKLNPSILILIWACVTFKNSVHVSQKTRRNRLGGPPNDLSNRHGELFPGIKRPGREVEFSPASSITCYYVAVVFWYMPPFPPTCLHCLVFNVLSRRATYLTGNTLSAVHNRLMLLRDVNTVY
jgi:hypothetical protein